MKSLLPLFLLLFSLHDALADGVICSQLSDSDCLANHGCAAFYDKDDGYICAPDCTADALQDQDTCENYAGCNWDDNSSECRFFYDSNNTGKYRTFENGAATIKNCPSDYPLAQPGTDSEERCYKACTGDSDVNGLTCGFYNDAWGNGGIVSCLEPNSYTLTPSNQYHREGTDGCYLNTRPCSSFGAKLSDNNTTLNAPNATGNATYRTNNYDVSNCSYNSGNNPILDSSLNCHKAELYPADSSSVPSANDTIVYNKQNGHYYCQSCKNNTYSPTTTVPSGYPNCQVPNGMTKACSCEKIPQGYYGTCNSNGWYYDMAIDACKEACPVGQTTSGPGTIGIEACQYSNDTKVCVGSSNNCISLNAIKSGTTTINTGFTGWKPISTIPNGNL